MFTQSMFTPRSNRGRRQLIRSIPVALGATVLTLAAPTAWLSSANAAGSTPTTTTVTASASNITLGASDTLTATVSIAVVGGLIVTPSGPVAFSASNANGSVALGSNNLSSCVFVTITKKACTATVTTTALPRGTDTVLANYGGDKIAAASHGTTTVTVIVVGTPANPSITQCTPGQACDTGPVFADNGSSSIDVAATASAGADTITTSLGGSPLACSTANAGEIGNYVVSDNKVTQTITYSMLGSAGDTFNNAYGTKHHVCYDSTNEFRAYFPASGKGWTGTPSDYANFGNAPSDGANGFVGLLPDCNANRNNTPCVLSQTFAAGGGPSGQDMETLVIDVAPTPTQCDPRVGG